MCWTSCHAQLAVHVVPNVPSSAGKWQGHCHGQALAQWQLGKDMFHASNRWWTRWQKPVNSMAHSTIIGRDTVTVAMSQRQGAADVT